MKKLLTITALVAFAVSIVFANNSPEVDRVEVANHDTAIIEFNKTSHNFGTITQGSVAKTTFTYHNKGNKDLILTNVRPSCGCTTPNWSREPLAPGDSAIIHVNFNSAGKNGSFHKNVTVTSNAGTVRLTIRGNIVAKPAEVKSPVRVDN